MRHTQNGPDSPHSGAVDGAVDGDGEHEGDSPRGGADATAGRLWPEHMSARRTVTETALLPSRAPKEDKFHRPVAPGALFPPCGTFDNTGVEADTADVLARGYRPCKLCWPDADGEAGGGGGSP